MIGILVTLGSWTWMVLHANFLIGKKCAFECYGVLQRQDESCILQASFFFPILGTSCMCHSKIKRCGAVYVFVLSVHPSTHRQTDWLSEERWTSHTGSKAANQQTSKAKHKVFLFFLITLLWMFCFDSLCHIISKLSNGYYRFPVIELTHMHYKPRSCSNAYWVKRPTVKETEKQTSPQVHMYTRVLSQFTNYRQISRVYVYVFRLLV